MNPKLFLVNLIFGSITANPLYTSNSPTITPQTTSTNILDSALKNEVHLKDEHAPKEAEIQKRGPPIAWMVTEPASEEDPDDGSAIEKRGPPVAWMQTSPAQDDDASNDGASDDASTASIESPPIKNSNSHPKFNETIPLPKFTNLNETLPLPKFSNHTTPSKRYGPIPVNLFVTNCGLSSWQWCPINDEGSGSNTKWGFKSAIESFCSQSDGQKVPYGFATAAQVNELRLTSGKEGYMIGRIHNKKQTSGYLVRC
jgi:hypothetical protein